MRVEHVLALRDARAPRRMVARLRGTVDAGAVTDRARGIERLLAAGRDIRRRSSVFRGRHRERAVVASGNRQVRERCNVLGDTLYVQRVQQHILALRILAHAARHGKQDDRQFLGVATSPLFLREQHQDRPNLQHKLGKSQRNQYVYLKPEIRHPQQLIAH